MARCQDCGGEVKWKPPFYVCLDCGLSFRRGEFEQVKKTIKEEFKEEMGESDEEIDRKDRRRKRDYHDWLMKKEED
ncbi:MAG: hypothetical protein H7641_14915 [Candidatus Heimdallarchaeota archaeon]|nr:hypothetical protein [Candidatus Heimdallarchaeota archaeon]MCK4878854.1 hypothetical protein [Candidatus Heimdallarchaeota archaeon]